ncbi:hypothetical protein [Rhodoblastus sp.]|uniref:hypothetical protein n=1 Tax=Rhodoblastus sp. TaxID=1962975 RepID=UPI0026132C98|nr:hypothetical protein [Rhodoblastus sp.]
MRSKTILVKLMGLLAAVVLSAPLGARAQSSEIPAWLQAHVGEGDGQIAPVVLHRARALYFAKLREGAVRNPCYFAMDATRPNDMGPGHPGRRFYIVCEAQQSFRAIAAGHGGGRDLKGLANFENGRQCAKNFGNALDSKLTTGGAYVTGETKTSFKGLYRASAGRGAALVRSFIQFDGLGEAANARERAIGGHAAELLRNVCLLKAPGSPHADREGHVPFGDLVVYAGGRSNGCTSWSPEDAEQVVPIMNGNPTTLYLYPESEDIAAVAKAGQGSGRAYWNAFCLRQIGAPKFWSQQSLGPIIAQYERDHPAPPPQPLPLCKGRRAALQP